MESALEDLFRQFDDIEGSAKFSQDSAMLRPRLNQFVTWPIGPEHNSVRELMSRFFDAKEVRVEVVYGALFVRVVACFENFVRRLLQEGLQRMIEGRTYDEVRDSLGKHNIRLTGRAMATIFEPSDHLKLDFQRLIDNLASCKSGTDTYQLNTDVFAAALVGTSPIALAKAFKNIQIDLEKWDKIAASPALKKLIGTSKTRVTAKEAERRLEEYAKLRNVFAHTGGGDSVISETQMFESIRYFRVLAKALSAVVMNAPRA